MRIFKFWLSEFLKTLENHIFKYLRFFEPLKDDPLTIQSSVFLIRTPFFTFNYSTGIFIFENVDVSKSKFEWVVSELLKCIAYSAG